MARARRADGDASPPTRGPTDSPLFALLSARRFCLSTGTERIAENLLRHGGEIGRDAAAWIGSGMPPADRPSIGLGEHGGTLGPHSFGFVNNLAQVAPFDAPLGTRPRLGGLGLLVPRRDALPDLGPLAAARGLSLSWIISVGDGDPTEALHFLNFDAATHSIALLLGRGAHGTSLRQALGAKPTVVWQGDAVTDAVARRAGCTVASHIGGFLAHAAMLSSGVAAKSAVLVLVVGGGSNFVTNEVRAAGLDAEVRTVDDRAPEALHEMVAQFKDHHLIVVAGDSATLPGLERPFMQADLRHPEELRALCQALGAKTPIDQEASRPRVDRALALAVRNEVERDLSDHNAKRLLKSYGARVSRQAPASTPTAAVQLAKTIGLPVLLVGEKSERVAASMPDVKRFATLLLHEAESTTPSVMVRETFPELPRADVKVQSEKGLGHLMYVGKECALLPLSPTDALCLSAATGARRASDQRAVADLLSKIGLAAHEEHATFELALFVGSDAAVLSASGQFETLTRPIQEEYLFKKYFR